MDPKVFNNKNILIAGGTGFIGQSLLKTIDGKNSRITVLSRKTNINKTLLRSKKISIISVKGDVADSRLVKRLAKDKDIILNFAGDGIMESIDSPLADLKTTCIGSLNILEACRNYNKQCKIIFSGSRMELGYTTKIPVKEGVVPHPTSFYGIHHYTVSQYVRLYYDLFGLRTTALRFSSTYGPRISNRAGQTTIVNNFINKALENKKISVYGDGSQLRDFLYVDDALSAILKAVSYKKADGEIFNIGSGERIKFIEMAKMVVKIVGKGRIEMAPWPKKHLQIETGDYVADYTKASKLLKWRPTTSLEDGIKKTVNLNKVLTKTV